MVKEFFTMSGYVHTKMTMDLSTLAYASGTTSDDEWFVGISSNANGEIDGGWVSIDGDGVHVPTPTLGSNAVNLDYITGYVTDPVEAVETTGLTMSAPIDMNGQLLTVLQAITDNSILTVDQVGAVQYDYARFTTNGLEGRAVNEIKDDLNLEDGDIETLAESVSINNVVEDTSPQLGAELDCLNYNIKGGIKTQDLIIIPYGSDAWYNYTGGVGISLLTTGSRVGFYTRVPKGFDVTRAAKIRILYFCGGIVGNTTELLRIWYAKVGEDQDAGTIYNGNITLASAVAERLYEHTTTVSANTLEIGDTVKGYLYWSNSMTSYCVIQSVVLETD